jgi:predicted dehydrogenase
MFKPIKIGVLGAANIAERSVIPAIKEVKKIFELIGIASKTPGKAQRFADKFNTNAYTDYQSLIDVKALEAVYIPLPNGIHYEWIKKALQNNKHVLVEKSLACTLMQVEELNHLAKEKNCVLLENFQFRYHSQLQYIKNLLNSGTIGELRVIRSSFGFPPFQDKHNIRYSKELGGGALLDAGSYSLKVVQELVDDYVYVDSASLFMEGEKKVDMWGSAYLKIKKSNLAAQIAFGFDNFYQCNVELWGSKGHIKANRIFTAPPGLNPEIEICSAQANKTILLQADNHFNNMLKYFSELIHSEHGRNREYEQNINQARLVSEVRIKSNE